MKDLEAILAWLDPDWRSHFRDAQHAAAHYKEWAPAEWALAEREMES